MAAVTICSDFGAQKNKVWHCFHCFPIYFPWSDGTGWMLSWMFSFVFWMLSFKSTFSLSTFTFIKRLFSSSSLSAIRLVSSAYLRLLIFLPAILIPACAMKSTWIRQVQQYYGITSLVFAAAAAAAKLLQSCLTLCDPIDSSPPGSPVPVILQARTLEWVATSFSNAWKWSCLSLL